jgi:DNA polymerase-3 subunit epsilon
MRQIILDTETTGISPQQGHRIIEIGCLELTNRRLTGRSFHYYLQPDRLVEPEAMAVHGITDEFLVGKPRFAEVAQEFLAFVTGAELIIHNAPFDIGFLNHEMRLMQGDAWAGMSAICGVLDTLAMAKARHPGQKNNLNALAKRYGADNRDRTYHGALLDAEILADVYLNMTGGQVGLQLGSEEEGEGNTRRSGNRQLGSDRPRLRVVKASAEELAEHEARLAALDKAAGGQSLWRNPEYQ